MKKQNRHAPLLAVLMTTVVFIGAPSDSSGAPPAPGFSPRTVNFLTDRPTTLPETKAFFANGGAPSPQSRNTFLAEQGALPQLAPVAASDSDKCGSFAKADPVPESNAISMTCADGKIRVTVGNEQQFANHIGGIVEVKVEILAADYVRFDLQSLQSGMLKFDGTKIFYLAKDNPVRITQAATDSGETLYTLTLRVQTFVPQKSVPFNIDLRYATNLIDATTTPDWKVLTTPTFLVKTSNTKDDGEVLLEGNMQPASVVAPAVTPWLFGVGGVLVSSWPLYGLFTWLNRRRPSYQAPANEVAWAVFHRVFEEGRARGYRESHIRDLTAALAAYLDIGTDTSADLVERFHDDPRRDTILGALDKCNRVLYGREKLSSEALTELYRELESLVPKPE